ncbi:DUF4625 domain-containing protein [Pseudozobellia sp. WGM2]|uniref:DUF4625 domain-containing protein n=1 Tax=Pseudozobellia sp. WGM2 TaxID=2787625 RepID=UPI001AE0083E|nr:DUF4625 domain-containing protein [Pseudozobellia sp. WGM2]
MKTRFEKLAVLVLIGITLHSCNSDDDGSIELSAPEITNFEYGEGHHGEEDGHEHEPEEAYAYKGSDVHLEAEINAEATVSSITLSIHSHDLDVAEDEEEWDFEQVYTDASYLVINPTFHEHVDIPNTAPEGEYHVTLTVTDENGNSSEVEGHLQIMNPITTSNVSIDEAVVRGSDFHLEFMIEAVKGIHNVSVDVHAHGLDILEGEEEWHFTQVYEEGLHGETSAEFHKHIDVPSTAPVGEYHMVITIEDEDENISKIDAHIDIPE